MKELILIACYWAHLVATVLWIGGIIFILFFALPSSRQVLGADAGKFMGEISKRFTPVANLSIVFLVITGAVLVWLKGRYSGITVFENDWTTVLMLKLFLVLVMIAVHSYRGLVLSPKIMRTAAVVEKATLQKLSLNLVKTNFILGLLVLLISGALPILRGY